MRTLFFAFVFLLFMFPTAVAAETRGRMDVLFIPGINNDKESEQAAVNKLRSALSKNYNVSGSLEDAIGGGFIDDEHDLRLLKRAERIWIENPLPDRASHEETKLWAKQTLADIIPILNTCKTKVVFAANEVARHAQVSGQVIWVTHSRGNLIAELALIILMSIDGHTAHHMVRVVNVGNTADRSVHGLNLTDTRDKALEAFKINLKAHRIPHNLKPGNVSAKKEEFENFTKNQLAIGIAHDAYKGSGGSRSGSLTPLSVHHNFVDTYLSNTPIDCSSTVALGKTYKEALVNLVETAHSQLLGCRGAFNDRMRSKRISAQNLVGMFRTSVMKPVPSVKQVDLEAVIEFSGAHTDHVRFIFNDTHSVSVMRWAKNEPSEYRGMISFHITESGNKHNKPVERAIPYTTSKEGNVTIHIVVTYNAQTRTARLNVNGETLTHMAGTEIGPPSNLVEIISGKNISTSYRIIPL